jgi:ATP-dependent helicase/DNAse subunit B
MDGGMEVFSFSQSKIKSFNKCPKQYEYKYIQKLTPKRRERPLFFGSWVHKAIESYYSTLDRNWRQGFAEYKLKWDALFEEEREALSAKGDPVSQIPRIMRGYDFYYKNDGWTPVIIEQEFIVETPMPGVYFKFVVDLGIVDDEDKLWVVDHKTASSIPPANTFHGMDPQLILYPWGIDRLMANGQFPKMQIGGVIYNYIKSKAPSLPQINKDGSLSKRKIVTDYPTLYLFLKQQGYDPQDFAHILVPLKKRSEFLRRYRLPRESVVTKQILLDALSVVKRIQETKRFTRSVGRDCRFCGYKDLCRAELNGFDTTLMRKSDFILEEEHEHSIDPVIDEADDSDEDGES